MPPKSSGYVDLSLTLSVERDRLLALVGTHSRVPGRNAVLLEQRDDGATCQAVLLRQLSAGHTGLVVGNELR